MTAAVPAAALPIDLGDGVVLAPTTAADAAEAYAVVDAERDRLRQWLPWVDSTRDVDTERSFLRGLEVANHAGTGLHATIRDHRHFGGLIGLRLDTFHASAEIGYWLAEAQLGKGVITRGVSALLDVAFGSIGLHRFQLLAATGNARSRRIAERLGMTHEGTMREAEPVGDRFLDLEIYSMLAGEWPDAVDRLSRD